jgi:hypothetical protein
MQTLYPFSLRLSVVMRCKHGDSLDSHQLLEGLLDCGIGIVLHRFPPRAEEAATLIQPYDQKMALDRQMASPPKTIGSTKARR